MGLFDSFRKKNNLLDDEIPPISNKLDAPILAEQTGKSDEFSSSRLSKINPESLPLAAFYLESILEQSPDSIYFKDLQSRFTLVSSRLAMLIAGTTDANKVIGKADSDFFAHEHAQAALADEKRIIQTGKPILDLQEKETYPDGHITWAQTSKMPLIDNTGTIVGTWGISHDITAQKKSEEDLKASNEQLHQAQKMEAFGQLAGGVAHDFNNMLGGILGIAQLLERKYGAADPRLRDNLAMIIDTAKRAEDLTGQLLAFARKTPVAFAPVDINQIISSVVKLLTHTIDRRIKIVERLYETEIKVLGDFGQLQNVMLNLAVNARDAMAQGGTLTFSSELVGSDSASGSAKVTRYVRIGVSDTGCGMDSATLARAFEPFFTTKPPGKGTGLGLASVYGTIKSHNGLIEVDSQVSKGTTFSLLLPLVEPQKQGLAYLGGAIVRGTGNILVVDDDDLILKVVNAMLKELGYTPHIEGNPSKAVSWYSEHCHEINLVIIDMNMPQMSGYECVTALKKINPNVVICMATGYNLASDTQKIISRGIAGFIQKPFNLSELSQTLADLLV